MNYLEEMVSEELERANVKHLPYFPSMEHAMFVIQEEVKEVSEENQNIKNTFKKMKRDSRKDDVKDVDFKRLEMFATNIITEAVQVLAMVRKYQLSKENINSKIEQIDVMIHDEFLGIDPEKIEEVAEKLKNKIEEKFDNLEKENVFTLEGKKYNIVKGTGTRRDCGLCDIKERCQELGSAQPDGICKNESIYYKQV